MVLPSTQNRHLYLERMERTSASVMKMADSWLGNAGPTVLVWCFVLFWGFFGSTQQLFP